MAFQPMAGKYTGIKHLAKLRAHREAIGLFRSLINAALHINRNNRRYGQSTQQTQALIAQYQALSELQLESFDRALTANGYLRGFISSTIALPNALCPYPHHDLQDRNRIPNTSKHAN